jgi:hypothetical protein
LLDEPKAKSGLPYAVLLVVAALIGAGAYYYGRRAGLQARPPMAVVAAPAVGAPVAPVPSVAGATPAPAAPPMPTDAGAPVASPTAAAIPGAPDGGVASGLAGGHQLLSAVLIGSLDQTVEGASPPTVGPALAMVIARLLVWWMQPAHDARPGDRLDVLYDTPAGQEPLIVALAYRSQKNAAEYRAYRYQPPGARFARYYRSDGSELEERLVGGPIEDYE